MSSIGIDSLRQDPGTHPDDYLGVPRWIRSDEYNVISPIGLSILATHSEPTLSPLGESASIFNRYPTGPIQAIVFFESTILRLGGVLPDGVLFAARWWIPILLVLLFLPSWIAQIGGSRKLGWLAAFLFVLAPATLWWSLIPLQCVAYCIAGCSLMLSGHRRIRRRAIVSGSILLLLAAVFLAGLPTFYVPWVFIISTPFLATTLYKVLSDHGQVISSLITVGATGVVALGLAMGTYLEGFAGFTSMLGTVYPGSRRSAASAEPFGHIFGAPALGPLQSADPTGINASELSTSFAICFIWAIVLLIAQRTTRSWKRIVPVWIFGVWGGIWLLWAAVDLGQATSKIPLLNLVPPSRANQVVGYVAIIFLVLVLSTIPKISLRLALLTGGIAAAVTGYSASLLRQSELPTQTSLGVLFSIAGVFVAVVLVSRFRTKVFAIVIAVVVAALPVARVNPIMVGLGDLRNSSTAKLLLAEGSTARGHNQIWASNMGNFDVLMLSNGVPALSGLQRSGPNKDEWKKLDPTGQFQDAWNRGGGYLSFQWGPHQPTKITSNGFDVIFVRIDPCTLKNAEPRLSHIVSDRELSLPCLGKESMLHWNGRDVFVYETNTVNR